MLMVGYVDFFHRRVAKVGGNEIFVIVFVDGFAA